LLEKLPLVEVPAQKPGDLFAVIYSGDGGWRDLDKTIAEILAKRGVPVVGVDSLRYFWREKTPDGVARDLAAILGAYSERWGPRKAVLIGYSFGAGILPFAVNRLPESARASVVQISLLGLEPTAPFEFHVSGWLGGHAEDGLPVLPELERIDPALIQCVYGEQEENTLCRAKQLARTERIQTTGGHHFDGDFEGLAGKILAGAEKRLAAQRQGHQRATTPVTPPEISAATSVSTKGIASPPGAAR
jgi:type IV secretory pathway VirJ component